MARKLAVCSAVALIISIAAPLYAQNDRYGVVASFLSPHLGDKSRELGSGYARVVVYWDALQPNGPGDWNDQDMRSWFAVARSQHLKLFVTLMNTPRWAGACPQCMPDRGADWQSFVYRVINEARLDFPGVEAVFGVWNEPNLGGPNGFFNGTAADYATLFALADSARRSANPAARLAGPEMSVGGPNPAAYLSDVMTRLQPYLAKHDVVSFHWYPGQGSLGDWVTAFASRSGIREVWLTETGDHTCNDSEQRSWIDFVVNTFDYGSPSSKWTKVFIYYLWDAFTDCSANLVRTDGSNRPAFVDYQNRALGRSTAVSPVTLQTANGTALPALDVLDMNGGELRDGDPVAFRSGRGLFLQAAGGGGANVTDAGFAAGAWETFALIDLDRPGTAVRSGDAVALRSSSGSYVSAALGGGGAVTADRPSIGAWETFRWIK